MRFVNLKMVFVSKNVIGLGDGISWLFSVSDEAPNGFDLTGGVFNRTVEVSFPNSGESATIRQIFKVRAFISKFTNKNVLFFIA